MDQKSGSLVFKSKVYEFRTDKIKPNEDYRLMIWLHYKGTELDCKILE